MIKNYFKTALRSFKRHKLFTLINIIGLSIGISAALVIWISSTAINAPRIAPKIAIQSRAEVFRSFAPAFIEHRSAAAPMFAPPRAERCGYQPSR